MNKEINLAPLRIKPSKRLWFAKLLFGCLLITASLLATFPLVIQNTQWLAVESVFVCANCLWLVRCYKSFHYSPIELNICAGEIFIRCVQPDCLELRPRINDDSLEKPVNVAGDILVWPWVIILHLAVIQHKQKLIRLIILQDSLGKEEWRQLRVYLLSQR